VAPTFIILLHYASQLFFCFFVLFFALHTQTIANLNKINCDVTLSSEVETEILMTGFRQLLVFLEAEQRALEGEANSLLRLYNDGTEFSTLFQRRWSLLDSITVHEALSEGKKSLSQFAQRGVERKKTAPQELLADMSRPVGALVQDVAKIRDDSAALKQGMDDQYPSSLFCYSH